MNVRRGMFRLWIVLTTIYVVGLSLVIYKEIMEPPYLRSYSFPTGAQTGFEYIIPSIDAKNHWKIEFDNNVDLYIPNGITKDIVDHRRNEFVSKYVTPRQEETRQRTNIYLIGGLGGLIIPPLVVLALGAALAWALSGFSRDRA